MTQWVRIDHYHVLQIPVFYERSNTNRLAMDELQQAARSEGDMKPKQPTPNAIQSKAHREIFAAVHWIMYWLLLYA
jgi:hypothetical protein